jgi:mannose-1-phosphate guanylyltransferase
MQAVILSGGFGTRLRPLTYTRAKSLLPIHNEPMVKYLIDKLPSEVDKVILAANYKSNQLKGYFAKNSFNMDIVVNPEPTPLGTAGALKFAEKYIDGTCILMNSDIISSLDLKSMLNFHRKNNACVTLSLWPAEDVSQFGVVKIEQGGKITNFVEKPRPSDAPSNLINAGICILEREVLDYIKPNSFVSLEQTIFPMLLQVGKPFYGYKVDGYWIDVGRLETYIKASEILLEKKGIGSLAGTNSNIKGEVDKTVFGNNVSVDRKTKVEHCVVFDCVDIENSTVTNSILGSNVKIKESKIQNCVIGDDEEITGKMLDGERVWSKPVPEGYPKKQVGNVVQDG